GAKGIPAGSAVSAVATAGENLSAADPCHSCLSSAVAENFVRNRAASAAAGGGGLTINNIPVRALVPPSAVAVADFFGRRDGPAPSAPDQFPSWTGKKKARQGGDAGAQRLGASFCGPHR